MIVTGTLSIQEFQVKELVVEDILRWFVIISVSVQIQKGKYHGVIDTGLAVVSYKNPRRIDIDAEDIVYHLKVSYMEYCSFHLKNYHCVNNNTHRVFYPVHGCFWLLLKKDYLRMNYL